MFGYGTLRAEWRCEDKTNVALLKDIAATVTHACLQPRISDRGKAPGITKVVCRLPGITYVKFQVIEILNRHEILFRHWLLSFVSIHLQQSEKYLLQPLYETQSSLRKST